MKRPQSFYWYDYETFGNRPSMDWPAQFAGIRTDENFNEIGPPLEIFCRFPTDKLPQPKACLITGLNPQTVNSKGVCEAEFIKQINETFSQPNTCVVGYNNLKFDDEVTRFTLYRNFMNPYAREWKNGNSRWDLIDTVRLCAALRPDGIEWPINTNGAVSFKLEDLTRANGIEHGNAHDAVSDVRATIALAKLIKKNKPDLLQYVLSNKDKISAAVLLDLTKQKPLVHISSRYPSEKSCLAVVIPLAIHPSNKNEVIVYDLDFDPEEWLSLSTDDIAMRVFSRREALEDKGLSRIPIKTVRLNRCPVLVPFSALRNQDKNRLGIDQKRLESHYEFIKKNEKISRIVQKIFLQKTEDDIHDPDQMLYSGGFFSHVDEALIQKVSNTSPDELGKTEWPFQDRRLKEMLFRYRARNWPETLTEDETKSWEMFCHNYFHGLENATTNESTNEDNRLAIFYNEIKTLMNSPDITSAQKDLLNSLQIYGNDIAEKYNTP